MFLQALAVRAGITTKRDLAQICRDMYPQRVVYVLWVVMEVRSIAYMTNCLLLLVVYIHP